MALRGLPEKSSDADLLREMIGFAAQRLMKLETEGLCSAAHGEHRVSTDSLPIPPAPVDIAPTGNPSQRLLSCSGGYSSARCQWFSRCRPP
jgi:hypothetical protein